MKIVAEKNWHWILAKSDENYYLSVLLQVSGATWDFCFKLNTKQVEEYKCYGIDTINKISNLITPNNLDSNIEVDRKTREQFSFAVQEYRKNESASA